MTVLRDGDIEIDGYTTGKGYPVHAFAVDPGSPGSRNQDAPNPTGDTVHFGRDRLDPSSWVLSFSAQHGSGKAAAASAAAALGALQAQWNAAEKRDTPGVLSVLRYGLAGRTRRVYGRPRRYAPNVTDLFSSGHGSATAEFQTVDALHYDDEAQSLDLRLIPGPGAGLRAPLRSPLRTAPGGTRQGIITGGGDAPTPFTATVYGPVSGPWLSGAGWKLDLPELVLAHDQTAIIDTRTKTVLRNDGARLAGYLSRTSYLTDAVLQPGAQEIIFGGTDPTGTSHADVSWRSAWHGI